MINAYDRKFFSHFPPSDRYLIRGIVIHEEASMIDTTLNIHVNILSRINHAALKLGKPRKEVIIFLLKRLMEDTGVLNSDFSTVKYQEDADPEHWRCFHIRFREDDYEYFLDLRKFSKSSVSCLLAMAVTRYLESLVEDFKTGAVDNYSLFRNYVLHWEVVEGIIAWHIYWGFPGNHLQTMRLPSQCRKIQETQLHLLRFQGWRSMWQSYT